MLYFRRFTALMTTALMTTVLMTTVLLASLALVTPALVAADPFPPITDAERAMTDAPGYPGAVAVVLFEKADLRLRDHRRDLSSRFSVEVRLKILKEEGKEYGEISVRHSRLYRLKNFEGRTVLPDGREVPLGEDSIFKERSSRSQKSFVTKAAFPSVEPGAILDYRYELVWDSMFFLEPWYFHNRIPTLLSQLTLDKPDNMGLQPWHRQTSAQKIESEMKKTTRGVRMRVWAEGLGPVPDEPHSFPFNDLSSRFMIVPTVIVSGGSQVAYFDSWKTVVQDFEQYYHYGSARNNASKASKKAKQLVSGKLASGANSPRLKAEALYNFVRDNIQTTASVGIYLSEDAAADRALTDGQGSAAEQAILLQAMLKAVKVKSKLVWTTDRREAHPDLVFPNPWWFDHVLVRIELDGEPVFLDPTDRRLAFGVIPPYYEGAQALLMDKKNPQAITLPRSSFEKNSRRAVLALDLDEEGRVTGTGSLRLAGHHARRRLEWKEDAAATAEAWQEWLADRFEGYEVLEVESEESVADQEVLVSWKLAQREEEVLGEETSLHPSLPLGPVQQILSLPTEQRLTPLMFSFADRDEVELTVTWPESWEIDLAPNPVKVEQSVGALVTSVAVDEENRRLELKRRFDLFETELAGREKYAALQDLYREVEKNDGQDLVLVRQ